MIGTPYQMFFSCNKAEKNKMGWTCIRHGMRRNAYRGLVKKPEGRRPLGRPRRRREDNI